MDVENEILDLNESIQMIDKRIPQMQAKEDFLFNRKKEGAMAYNALSDKKRKLDKEYNDILRDLQEIQLQSGGQSFMQRLRLSMTSQRCLEHRLDTIRKEIADLEKELYRAETEQNERIKEYEEYTSSS